MPPNDALIATLIATKVYDARVSAITGYVLASSGYGVDGALAPSSRFQQRDEGVPRQPGGPPHLGCCGNYLGAAHTQSAILSPGERRENERTDLTEREKKAVRQQIEGIEKELRDLG